MSEPEIMWEGTSGKKYGYWIRSLYTNWKELPGNYIYAKETSPGSRKFLPVYIGQTVNLSQRLADHEKEAEAIRRGATHIHAHTSSASEDDRLAEERDLIVKWSPPCNERL
jgi:predicted GIY-YIG superfamily endonuclease